VISLPSWTLVTPPASDSALDLATVKAHLRVDLDIADYDAILAVYMQTAQTHVEGRIGRALSQQTWRAGFERRDAHDRFEFSRGPLPQVLSVQYLAAGTYQTLDSSAYAVRAGVGRDSLIVMRPQSVATPWPSADRDPAAWTIDVQVGWTDAAAIPSPISAAMLLIIGDLFSNRDAKVQANIVENPAVDMLLAPYRNMSI
jgi:uncharacterized phiE125 gp8 family phage protein